MNGAQDMGGMQGFGPVLSERDEPPFHAEWERRVFALTLAMAVPGQWNLDMARYARETLPPALYLSSGYYRIWYEALVRMMLQRGLLTPDEVADGLQREPPPAGIGPRLAAGEVAALLARGGPAERAPRVPARFALGDRVRTRLMNPGTHTRLPRYARGKSGRIVRVHGVHVYPDASAQGLGEQPQWLYSVRFEAADLWGPDTTASCVHADCWEPYLEPA
ncbi:MAG: nitrile hydratase subunit beta [Burkholderiales bacterium]|nr:MAG: nitrile hydratase subunit beta [Burkholderiales bacterium]